jgi:diguanylate cyclase (GGDEF)-like protein
VSAVVSHSARVARASEAVIGRRAAAALLAILIAGLSGVGLLLAHDIHQREHSAVAAHLRVNLEVAVTEIANEAAQAQQKANSLATQPSLQRALAHGDARSLARLTAGVRGATVVPEGSTPPTASALMVRREARVLAAGQLLGTVIVTVPLDGALLSRLRSLAPLRPGEGFLLVHGDRIVAAPQGLSSARLSAYAQSVRLDKASYLVGQTTLVRGPTPSRLAALAPAAEVSGPVAHATRLLILSLIATLATLLLLAGMLARPVLGPLRALAREAQSAGEDELTQLANRRTFTAAGTRELARARRSQRPLAVVLIDVDDFKWVNDTLGHAAGDNVLRAVAEMLRAQTRELDLAARYGGDEFALLLLETDKEGALEAAERFHVALAERALGDGRTLPSGVTASIGVAAGVELSLDELVAEADSALYRAKQAGKNRTADAMGSKT